MKKCIFFIGVILLSAVPAVCGQAAIKPMQIGDTMPEMVLGQKLNLLTGKLTDVKLSDYAGKVVVLDFFHTMCKSCIGALPGFRELELKRKGFSIIPVTSESADDVHRWFSLSKKDKSLYPEMITSDSLLKLYFPHQVISHLVWMDSNRVIRAITDKEYLTTESIEKVISGEVLNWPQKKELPEFDFSLPLVGVRDQVVYDKNASFSYSVLAPYINGVERTINILQDSVVGRQRITLYNMGIIDLYLYTYGKYSRFANSQIQFDVANLFRFIYDTTFGFKRSWSVENEYCYEAVMPLDIPLNQRNERIRADLDNKFGLDIKMINKEVPCYALVDITNAPLAGYKCPVHTANHGEDLYKKNMELGSLLFYLNNRFNGRPVLNETTKPDTFLLPKITAFNSIPELNRVLYKSGLQIIPVHRELPILVVREADTQ